MRQLRVLLAMTSLLMTLSSQVCTAADTTKSRTLEWKAYRNSVRGFEVSFPSDGRIVSESPAYVRIQNYEPADTDGLKAGEFYLEIHFYELPGTCDNWTPSKRKSIVGNTLVFKQHLPDEVDAGGDRYVLCAFRHDHIVAVGATENNKRVPLARRIIGTIKLEGR